MLYKVLHRPEEALNAANDDGAALRDYFNLSISLSSLFESFSRADLRFERLSAFLPGTRMLRQVRGRRARFRRTSE